MLQQTPAAKPQTNNLKLSQNRTTSLLELNSSRKYELLKFVDVNSN